MNLPNPNSREWADRMDEALANGNLGAMADLLLAGIAKPVNPLAHNTDDDEPHPATDGMEGCDE